MKIVAAAGNAAGLGGTYCAGIFCDVLHAEGGRVLATYGSEFYQGKAAVTVNAFGNGSAYYIASRNEPRFHDDLYRHLIDELKLRRALGCELPAGVTAQVRTDGTHEFIFVLGFNRESVTIELGNTRYREHITGTRVAGTLCLPPYTARILERLEPGQDG